MVVKVLVLATCLWCSGAAYTADYYTAAVFEHLRIDDPRDRASSIAANLDAFEAAAMDAAHKGADIIVFPEIGIMPSRRMTRRILKDYYEEVPNPDQSPKWVPCSAAGPAGPASTPGHPVVTRLSCIAKRQGIYVAANIGEREPCSPLNDTRCPTDVGTFFYNTDVVFDANGTLVAKHRKRFPFFEKNISRPRTPQYTFFNTSFGSFGVIICFDTVFVEAVELVEKYKVENMIISTWWFDELPFLSAVEFFQGWAVGNGVNALVSNVHQPSAGSLGSSIISGKQGTLVYTFKPTRNSSELLIAKVPRNKNYAAVTTGLLESNSVSRELHGYSYTNTDMSNYTLTRLENASGVLEACNNGLCCRLSYAAQSRPKNTYLGAFRGIRSVRNHYYFCQEVCTLTRCGDENCTTFPTVSDLVFDIVALEGNVGTPHQYPGILGSEMKVIPRRQWNFSPGRISFGPGQVGDPLLSVTIHGRCYDKDPPFPDS